MEQPRLNLGQHGEIMVQLPAGSNFSSLQPVEASPLVTKGW